MFRVESVLEECKKGATAAASLIPEKLFSAMLFLVALKI